MGNLENVLQSTQKSRNWDFDGILLSFTEELCVTTMMNDAKYEEEFA